MSNESQHLPTPMFQIAPPQSNFSYFAHTPKDFITTNRSTSNATKELTVKNELKKYAKEHRIKPKGCCILPHSHRVPVFFNPHFEACAMSRQPVASTRHKIGKSFFKTEAQKHFGERKRST